MSSPRTGILSWIRFDLGWVESWVVAHSMEEFKQSVEWFRRLYTLRFWGVKWRVKAQGVGGGGGCKLSHQWGGCTIHLSCRWVVEEVIQFIWVRGGWWRRLYSRWRRLYSFVEEVIHPVEEVIHTLVILVSAQVPLVLTLGLWTLGLQTWAWQIPVIGLDIVERQV